MLETSLGFAGLALAIVGIVISLLVVRRSRIVVYIRKWSKIVDDITRSIDGLEVRYKGAANLQNLVRVTGFVENAGNADLDNRDVHGPLTITLPSQSRWLEVNCSSETVKPKWRTDGPQLVIEWDMIERGRKIRFDALLEFIGPEQGRKLPMPMRFASSGRIKNTQIRTLRDVGATRRPVLHWTDIFPALLIMMSVVMFTIFARPTASETYTVAGKEVDQYSSADGRLCLGSRSAWFPWVLQSECEHEFPKAISQGDLQISSTKKAPILNIGTLWVPLVGLTILTTLTLGGWGLDKFRLIQRQRRHFGTARFFRIGKDDGAE